MTKLYLKPDGTVRTLAPGAYGHLDMARTILGPDWHGDSEDGYVSMWEAGFVRVVDSPDTLVGEQWVDGKPVAFASLPWAQQEWFAVHSMQAGKEFIWNAMAFSLTRDGQPEIPPTSS